MSGSASSKNDEAAADPLSAPRFYAPDLSGTAEILRLGPGESHHLSRVLRLKPGDAVIVFNGRGGWAPGCVESADRKSSVIRPKGFREECRPPGVRLRQALPKGAKQDFVLQKAVELGADEVAFIETDRSVARLPPPGEEDTRLRRWRETVIAAAKQCGAAWLTGVCADAPLDVWLRRDADRPVLVADVRPGARPLCAAWNPSSSGPSPAVYIGPEGGWSDGERALFDRAGAVPVRLGPRVLRTETAPLFVLSAWRYACDSD